MGSAAQTTQPGPALKSRAGHRAYIKQLLGCSWPMPLGLVQAIQASGQAWAYFEGSMVKLGRAGLGAMF
jgi:hypothetical protein